MPGASNQGRNREADLRRLMKVSFGNCSARSPNCHCSVVARHPAEQRYGSARAAPRSIQRATAVSTNKTIDALKDIARSRAAPSD